MIGKRHAIVEVRWAKAPVRKAVIDPGGTLRIGRTERADLAVPDDQTMSAIHCELRWDGATCRVVDRASREGTFLDGERVSDAVVKNGSWIRAGSTIFSIYIEGATAPRTESGLRGDGTDPLTPLQRDALEVLEAQRTPLFAVLDASRTLRVIELLRESVEDYRSLYEGIQGEALAMQAPYLVRLAGRKGERSRLLQQLVLEGWNRRWGLYLTCSRSLDEVRTQLRRLLMVHNDKTDERMFFRFYDPKMLRLVLPTCSLRQREQIFGEIEAFLVENPDGELVRLTATEAPATLTTCPEPTFELELQE